jgi:predicted DNA-binding transcriptional regulator AlpA
MEAYMKHNMKPVTQSLSTGANDESIQAYTSSNSLPEKLLPIAKVKEQVGFGSSYLYELIQQDKFPKPVKVGNASRWRQSEVQAWIAEQIQNSRLFHKGGEVSA